MALEGSALALGLQDCVGRGLRRPCGAGRRRAGPGGGGACDPAPPAPSRCSPRTAPPPPSPRGAARAPLGVRRASMAFLTAWKGAASGKSNRRYLAGRGRGVAGEPPATGGTDEGHSWRQQCGGRRARGEGQRTREGQPGASRTPICPCSQPQQGYGLAIPVALKPHFPCCNMWATCESSSGELDLVGCEQLCFSAAVPLTHLVLPRATGVER